jgi:hypothetical protein
MGKVNAMHQDKVEAEYERGATDAYYGRQRTPNISDEYLLEAYLEGYDERPYGEKDYGDEYE